MVQTGKTALTGLPGSQNLVLALGFGGTTGDAGDAATGALAGGFDAVASAYADGWHGYLAGLNPEPASAAAYGPTYDVSAMALAAHEDKTFRGAYVASPTMPWAWGGGTGLENPSGAYHLVWARDLYEIATALIAAGDRAGAERALSYLFDRQQKPDGSFPQNSTVDGTPHWTNLQLDEVAYPIILAWQLGRTDAATYTEHIKKAADFIVGSRTRPSRRRSAGRTRAATRPRRSPPRSPGWSARPTSRAATATPPRPPATSAPPTTGRSASTTGPPRTTARTGRSRTTCG